MRHLLLVLASFLLLASCRSLDGHFEDASFPVSSMVETGHFVVHDRSVTNGGNYLDVTEMPPRPEAPAPTDPNQVTIETNVVLLKRGTRITSDPYELLAEGTLKGRVSGEFALDLLYSLESYGGDGRIATVRLPFQGHISRLNLFDMAAFAKIPVLLQDGKLEAQPYNVYLTVNGPLYPRPLERWTTGLLLLPLSELLFLVLPPKPVNIVSPESAFTEPYQRLQLVGEDGVVWGELEGDAYRVFSSPTAPPADEVIRVLAMVRLEVWMFKNLITSKPPKTRNVRYLP